MPLDKVEWLSEQRTLSLYRTTLLLVHTFLTKKPCRFNPLLKGVNIHGCMHASLSIDEQNHIFSQKLEPNRNELKLEKKKL